MKRFYGVIKDTETAVKFVNDLYEATTTDEGGPVTMLSDFLPMSVSTMNSVFNKLTRQGIVTATITEESKQIVLDVLTRDRINNTTGESLSVTSFDTVACIGDGLFIVVRPNYEGTSYVGVLMTIVHTYTYQDGNETKTGSTTMDLRHPNDNGAAPGLAYEITVTKSGDALVKIASCVLNYPDTEEVLGPIFTSIKIHSYTVGNGISGKPEHIFCARNHSAAYFGAPGSRGGFVLHAMHSDNTKYGITVFNVDATPLFTFVAGGKPFNTLTSDESKLMYTIDPIGRNVSDKRVDDEDPESPRVIKMGVLAPIFCPSYDDRAEWAKWMQQGPHDYSYFDRSGHIRLKSNESSSDTVFFMDYGVALWDGAASEYSSSDKAVPDIDPRNLSTYDRPDIDYPMPNSVNMYGYFDSLSGLSDEGWMNFKDPSNDMIFVGNPSILSDGACRFTGSLTGSDYGYFNGMWYPYQGVSGDKVRGTIIYLVFKTSRTRVPNFPAVQGQTVEASYINTLLSNISNTYDGNSDTHMAYLGLAYRSAGSSYYDPEIFMSRDNDHRSNAYASGVSGIDSQYVAMAIATGVNSNEFPYKIFRSGSLVKSGSVSHDAYLNVGKGSCWVLGGGAKNSSVVPPRFSTMWGVPNFNPAGGRFFNEYPSGYSDDGGVTYFDVKFCAIGHMGYQEGQLGYDWFSEEQGAGYIVDKCLRYLCNRFNV